MSANRNYRESVTTTTATSAATANHISFPVVQGHRLRLPENLNLMEKATSSEVAVERLAEFLIERGHSLRRIRIETNSQVFTTSKQIGAFDGAYTEEIKATLADMSVQIVIVLANRPSVDEKALLELAAYKVLLTAVRSEIDKPTRTIPRCSGQMDSSALVIPNFIGTSQPMLAIYEAIRKTAPLNETILITGERGTGKELVARAIHDLSPRKNKPFIAVNCTALSADLVESQLFGHRKGSFTGALFDQLGHVRAAQGGTLFLDEIGNLPPNQQGKLLRLLQELVVMPVGMSVEIKVDVRFLAATNKDLEQEVRAGNFGADLYDRLNVLAIHLPPLRERREDISELIRHFITQNSHKLKFDSPPVITQDALKVLSEYNWPGNVRALDHATTRMVLNAGNGGFIDTEVARQETAGELTTQSRFAASASVKLSKPVSDWAYESETIQQLTRRIQREALDALVNQFDGDAASAARELGMSTSAFNQFRKRTQKDVDDASK